MDERFQRHSRIPDWKQRELAEASVVIAGVGALGNETARILAMSGVGRLLLCDPDTVAESNLSRTVLFRSRDVGRLKVEVAAEALRDLAPGLQVDARPAPLTRAFGLAELRDASLVISCVDSNYARLRLNRRCRLVGAPFLDGGTHPWGGEVRPFLRQDGPCFGCTLSPADRSRPDPSASCTAPGSEPEGAAAPSSALVGSWMGSLAVRYLMGLPVSESLLRVDLTRGTTSPVTLARDPECPHDPPLDPARRIPVRAADSLATLGEHVPREVSLVLWYPALRRVECRHCGFGEERWGIPQPTDCPACGKPLQLRTTLEPRDAPPETPLASLGVPAREILTLRTPTGLEWVELEG